MPETSLRSRLYENNQLKMKYKLQLLTMTVFRLGKAKFNMKPQLACRYTHPCRPAGVQQVYTAMQTCWRAGIHSHADPLACRYACIPPMETCWHAGIHSHADLLTCRRTQSAMQTCWRAGVKCPGYSLTITNTKFSVLSKVDQEVSSLGEWTEYSRQLPAKYQHTCHSLSEPWHSCAPQQTTRSAQPLPRTLMIARPRGVQGAKRLIRCTTRWGGQEVTAEGESFQ